MRPRSGPQQARAVSPSSSVTTAHAGASRQPPRRTEQRARVLHLEVAAAARRGNGLRRALLPLDLVAEPGALEHLEREQRALHARRGDVDPEQLEDELAIELQQLVDVHALDLV